MVPALLLATTPDGREKIAVWLRLPDGRSWTVTWSKAQRRFVPSYPGGTSADRVDLVFEGGSWRIADVRGTSFTGGAEEFHVLRPDPSRGGELVGAAWRRDDALGERAATERLVVLACHESDTDVAFMRRRNACAHCHEHDKAAQRVDLHDDLPFGPTDASGLYQILNVLRDETEVDDSRARDVNADSPYVRFRCASGASRIARNGQGVIKAICPRADEVPIATFDLPTALGEGAPHARAVCASRRYLHERGDDRARRAFATAFAECGFE